MERILHTLFDYQRFANDERLSAVIGEVSSGYCVPLSDDDLEMVNAAGEISFPSRPGAMGEPPHV